MSSFYIAPELHPSYLSNDNKCFSTDSSESDSDEVSDDEDSFVSYSAKTNSKVLDLHCSPEKPVIFQHSTIHPSLFNPRRTALFFRQSCPAIVRIPALQQDDSKKSLL